MDLRAIVACGRNRVIGRDGRLPWRIREDWQYFWNQTATGTMLLGRRCFEELRALKQASGRPMVVVSTTLGAVPETGVAVAPTLAEGLARAGGMPSPVWVCGGQRIYEETLPLVQRLYLTLVEAEPEGDTWFPEWRHRFTRVLSERASADARHRYTFYVLAPADGDDLPPQPRA